MIFTPGSLRDAYVLRPERIEDHRGFFARTFCRKELAEQGLAIDIVQANVSGNRRPGTLRGLHYQAPPYQETKIVRCSQGGIYDVIADLRPESATHGAWMGVELTAENGHILYVPEGFAHGYITLTPDAEVSYFVSEMYAPDAERGVRYNDPLFGIEWPLPVEEISEKDASWPDYRAKPTPPKG
jgi:dTDP-4-dehydrorhamnose 3,5-epimerase